MKIYAINNEYVRYLKGIDSKVPDVYGGGKPFVGIIVSVEGHNYMAPLTSYKIKQDRIRPSMPTCVKLHEHGNPENKLGMIQLNNMIPVLESEVSLFDFEAQNTNYRRLLIKQHVYIKTVIEEIETKALKLHRLVTISNDEFLCRLSCDFKLLEAHYTSYGKK